MKQKNNETAKEYFMKKHNVWEIQYIMNQQIYIQWKSWIFNETAKQYIMKEKQNTQWNSNKLCNKSETQYIIKEQDK